MVGHAILIPFLQMILLRESNLAQVFDIVSKTRSIENRALFPRYRFPATSRMLVWRLRDDCELHKHSAGLADMEQERASLLEKYNDEQVQDCHAGLIPKSLVVM